MLKNKVQKILGNLLDNLKKLYMMNGTAHLEIFCRPEPIEDSRPCLLFRTDIYRLNSRWVPLSKMVYDWQIKTRRDSTTLVP